MLDVAVVEDEVFLDGLAQVLPPVLRVAVVGDEVFLEGLAQVENIRETSIGPPKLLTLRTTWSSYTVIKHGHPDTVTYLEDHALAEGDNARHAQVVELHDVRNGCEPLKELLWRGETV